MRLNLQLRLLRVALGGAIVAGRCSDLVAACILLKQQVIDELLFFAQLRLEDVNLGAQLGVLVFEEVSCHLLSKGIIVQPLAFLFNVSRAHPAYLKVKSTRVFGGVGYNSTLVNGVTLVGIAELDSVVADTVGGSRSFLKHKRSGLGRLAII